MPVASAHVRFVRQAIECFQSQTYEPRELVPIAQEAWTSEDVTRAMLAAGLIEGIPPYVICPTGAPLGWARNTACAHARGEYIAHWDVDDWYAPQRLTLQVSGLEVMELDVCGAQSAFFWDQRSRQAWRYDGAVNANLGTSLCYRRDWWLKHPFPDTGPRSKLGEDGTFVNAAIAAERYLAMGSQWARLFVARDHDANTCQRPTGDRGEGWTRIEASDLPSGFWAAEIEEQQ